jgi:hypothetical protein
MTDDNKTVTEVMEPVSVTVIGTGDGLIKGAKAVTPADQPNIVLNVVQPFVAIGVRFAHNYVGAVVALVTAGMTSEAIPYTDFRHLLLKCAGLAFGGAAVMVLKDVVTIFGRLEGKYPLASGSV